MPSVPFLTFLVVWISHYYMPTRSCPSLHQVHLIGTNPSLSMAYAFRIQRPWLPSTLLLSLLLALMTRTPLCLAQDSNEINSRFQTISVPAQTPESTSTMNIQASATSSAPAQTHTIQVGLADHKFRPDVTNAAVGDTIEFRFYPSNHSVVRAEYGFPCIPYEMTGSNKRGFFSGFNAIDKVLDDPPKYQIRVNDSSPIFFYCSAPGSCITYAMVGAINPNTSTPISKQQGFARDSSYMLNPGEPFPAESPLPTSNPATAQTTKKSLGGGAIAGIVIASLSVVVLAALLFFFWGRTKTLKDEVNRKESTITRRISPSSSTAAMMEIGHSPASSHDGPGIFQHYTQTPGRQHPLTTATNTPINPYSPATYFSSPTNAVAAASRIQRAPSHRSVGGTFELSPAGDYARSPVDARTCLPPLLHQRSASPHCLTQNAKLGPYGRQVLNDEMEPAPSYYDTVYRPLPVHVNQAQGPAEMDATVPAAQTAARKPTWQEVKADGSMF